MAGLQESIDDNDDTGGPERDAMIGTQYEPRRISAKARCEPRELPAIKKIRAFVT